MDELMFKLFGTKRQQYIQRKVGEHVNNNCLNNMVKHGEGHVLICGDFGGGKVGDMVKIKLFMDKNSYCSILVYYVVPSGIRNIGQRFIFQQDNPKYTSKLCLNYLKTQQTQKSLKIMIWPPQSPDFNPIKKLWDELDRKVRNMYKVSGCVWKMPGKI